MLKYCSIQTGEANSFNPRGEPGRSQVAVPTLPLHTYAPDGQAGFAADESLSAEAATHPTTSEQQP